MYLLVRRAVAPSLASSDARSKWGVAARTGTRANQPTATPPTVPLHPCVQYNLASCAAATTAPARPTRESWHGSLCEDGMAGLARPCRIGSGDGSGSGDVLQGERHPGFA